MHAYLTRTRLVCFDPADTTPTAEETAAQTAAAAQAAAAALIGPDGKLTQEQVNKIMAVERRKAQQQITKIQETLEATLESKNLSQAERERMEQQLESIVNTNRTEKEKAQAAIAAAKKDADAAKQEASEYQKRFYDSQMEQTIIQTAIAEGAFRPDQLVDLLGPKTRLVPINGPDGKFTGDYGMVTTITVMESPGAGQPMKRVTKDVETAQAVQMLKSSPELHGNFFKSGVVSGIGSGSGAGTSMGGRIDIKNLSAAQYQEIRAKNPELLGLRPLKRGRK